MTILGWYEHLSAKDMPPEWMWHLPLELEAHFEAVKASRESGRDDDDDEMPSGPVIKNEYARGRGRDLAVANV